MSITDQTRKQYVGAPRMHVGTVGATAIAILIGNPAGDGVAGALPASISMSVFIDNRSNVATLFAAFPTGVATFDAVAEAVAGRFKTIDPLGNFTINAAVPYFILWASAAATPYEIAIVHEETSIIPAA